MAAQAIPLVDDGRQLKLHDGWVRPIPGKDVRVEQPNRVVLCASCRDHEARYGFRDDDEPSLDRPQTLCFSCFRVELTRRQAVRARLARGWNAQQVSLPLEETLKQLTHRRRQAQIAARHVLGL